MDPTALPTDNLYKFMALAGLGITGFCLWFWWTRRAQLEALMDEIDNDIAAAEARVEAMQNEHAATKKFGDSLRGLGERYQRALVEADQLRKSYPEDAGRLASAVSAAADELAVLNKTHVGRADAVLAALNEVNRVMKLLRVQMEKRNRERVTLRALRVVMFTSGLLGLVLSVAGFALWYTRVQWYADRLAKAEFEDKWAELWEKRKARDAAAWREQHSPPAPSR